MQRPVLGQRLRGELFRQQDSVAGDHPAGLRQCAVAGNEVAAGDAVAVDEQQVGAGGLRRRAVARSACAEATILLPHMRDWHRRLPGEVGHQRAGVIERAIVGHQHLEVAIGLGKEAGQHRAQRVRPVVGGGDHRDQWCARHRSGVRMADGVSGRAVSTGCRRSRGSRASAGSASSIAFTYL